MGASKKTKEEINASKQTYINNNKAAFLASKDDTFISEFEAKEVDKQYNSISSWKTKQKNKIVPIQSGSTIIKNLDMTLKLIQKKDDLTDEVLDILKARLGSITEVIEGYKELVTAKKAKKEELESQLKRIKTELKNLK